MSIKTRNAILPIFIALVVVSASGIGIGGYEGVMFYQSKKLIKQGDQLVKDGLYADALDAYEKAGRKFKPIKKKITAKVQEAQEFKNNEEIFKSGMESFGKGEWQKCLEYLGEVSDKYPDHETAAERYSDCEKKIAEEAKVAADAKASEEAKAAQAAKSVAASASKKSTSGNSTQSSSSSSSSTESPSSVSQTQARPVLYLPFSSAIMPDGLMPMGETIMHADGHPGIDFSWNNPSGTVQITASMEATVIAIQESENWPGTYDVATKNGKYGVDYTELGGVRSGLQVGDTVKVGDVVGYPQHPSNVTDQPNYKMLHWQFGYVAENNSVHKFVSIRLCPLSYFDGNAKSTIESIWATTDWPEMKANAPAICSRQYAE